MDKGFDTATRIMATDLPEIKAPSSVAKNMLSLAQDQEQMRDRVQTAKVLAVTGIIIASGSCGGLALWLAQTEWAKQILESIGR